SAPGMVKVISTADSPPSRQAQAMVSAVSAFFVRMTATTPRSDSFCRTFHFFMAILPFKMFGQTGWFGERFRFSAAKQRGAFQKGKSNGFKLAEIPCMRSGPAPPDPRTATFSNLLLSFSDVCIDFLDGHTFPATSADGGHRTP